VFKARVPFARAAAAATIAAATLVLASCGTDNPNDGGGQPGKQLFVQKCGSCHVLAAAETKGVTGPNLDNAFKQSLESGIKRGTIESVVRKQIEIPMGNVMPADLVTGEQADAVAAYVAGAVGEPAPNGGAKPEAGGTGKANAKNEIDNPPDPTGQLAYKYTDLEAKAGKVTLLATNKSTVPHNIALKDGPTGKIVSGGQTSSISTNLKAGKYTFYCSVPGHEQAGMKGTLKID
jgi:mono/diheme cytochrome c family protein